MGMKGRDGGDIRLTPRISGFTNRFAIYIADIYSGVEYEINGVRALPFVDYITWLAVGEDVAELIKQLEQRLN
jgi:hypothetical protein